MRPVLLTEQAFFHDLLAGINRAEKRVYVQFMSFEGDAAGTKVMHALVAARRRGVDVRVIIDDFTDKIIGDRFVFHHLIRKEARNTRRMITQMRTAGIDVVRTRPFGPGNLFFLFRNHKKIVIIDESAYIGGPNIAAHHLVWHDFMVRMNDPGIVRVLADDFLDTWQGKASSKNYKGIVVTNRELERKFDEVIAGARREIVISSPYFAGVGIIRKLAQARPGVKISLYTLKSNNVPFLRLTSPYVLKILARLGVSIHFYKRFSHAKLLIVDQETVVFGSSNFGTESFRAKEEIGICLKDRAFARELFATVIAKEPMIAFKDRHVPWITAWISAIVAYVAHVGFAVYVWVLGRFVLAVTRQSRKVYKSRRS